MQLVWRLGSHPIIALLGAALVGCGGASGGEETLGGSTTSAKPERYDAQIAHLKRELREGRRRLALRQHAAEATNAGFLDAAAITSFGAFASGLGGQVGLTVGRVGGERSVRLGSLATGEAWSTIKVVIAAKVLSDRGGPDGLSPSDRDLIVRAITASDNAAAESLFNELSAEHGGITGAAAAVAEPLRQAGDLATVVSTQGRDGFSPYGQTDWSLEEQNRFMAELAGRCVPDETSANYLLELMGRVIPSQRWGIAVAGVPAAFKGGWGPESNGGYLVRQMGVLQVQGHPVVVTAAALPDNGQFATGQQMLTRLAQWVVAHVDAARAVTVRC